jgi:hypothetical protein
METMAKSAKSARELTFLAALFILVLVVGVSANAARGDAPLDGQLTLTNVDPNGNGKSTFTVFYHLTQQAEVGTTLTVPIKLYVANLTGFMSFLQDYTVTVSLKLSNGRSISGQARVNSTQAAENLGAGQLHAGQEWGPVNVTIPLTQTNTGVGPGQEALGNATMRVDADVWFNQPINFYRPEGNQSGIGYILVSNGTPSGPEPNYPAIALLGFGVILVAVSFVMRPKKPSSRAGGEAPPKKAPGSV